MTILISHEEAKRRNKEWELRDWKYPDSTGVYLVTCRRWQHPEDRRYEEYRVVRAYIRDDSAEGTVGEWVPLPDGAVKIALPANKPEVRRWRGYMPGE